MIAQSDPHTPIGAGQAHVKASATESAAAGPQGSPGGLRGRVTALTAWIRRVVAWWNQTRAARANARFGAAGGGVLTGGIAYATLFSVFAGLTIGYTVFMAVLGSNDALREDMLDAVAANLPGLVDTGSGSGLLEPDSLQLSTGLNLTGLIAAVVLLVSATSALSSLRTAVRAMFDAGKMPENALLGKARDLAGFVGLALAVLLSAVLSVAASSLADSVLRFFGVTEGAGAVVQVLVVAAGFVVDVGTFMLIVWVLAGQRPPFRDLLGGALIAAVGLGAMRIAGTSLVARGADRNALLASFAAVVTLLVWVNLMSRIVLLAAAWTADPPAVAAEDDTEAAAASA
ncbi:YihY/virulence factor BrkB family protein [Cellulomonas cellasea]|uniref:YihY/virulence factor BrkB family protein n=1 Tax=Cellulomonas cellasea TaxID=43670 RepID=UPI0025A3D6AC|nr:YihY/virulence factor BrkB family protein [Cellulomonas cellasea]MDM8086190.1 YihY/virulence factor BrkB family protein [Cellulomonas cellasea]